MEDTSDSSTTSTTSVTVSASPEVDMFRGLKRKNTGGLTDSESDIEEDEYKPLPRVPDAARSTPPIKFVDEKRSKRPLLYSENSYGLYARGRHTNHLTIECLVSVPAQLFIWDDALGGFLPFGGHTICNVNLLQQITCQQTLSPSLIQPSARNSWSADHTSNNNTLSAPSVAKVTPIWEYSIQCQRKSDSKTVIECILAPHMSYICSSLPTFHHWRISDKKFALSFGSDYSASKFHNRLQKALSHLSRQSKSTIAGSGESNLDAPDDLDDDVFVATDSAETPSAFSRNWPQRSSNYMPTICPSLSITNHLNEEVDCPEEDASTVPPLCSMLPSSHSDDRPPNDPESARPPGSSLTLASVDPCVNCHKCYGSFGFMSYNLFSDDLSAGSNECKKMSLSPKNSDATKPKLVQSSSSGTCSTQEKASLKFGKMRSIRSSSNPGSIMLVQKLSAKSSREADITKSKSLLEAHLKNTYASNAIRNASFELIQRELCKYCQHWYNVKDNKRGDCPDAPDAVEKWIKKVTLYSWATRFVNRRIHQRQNDSQIVCESSCFTNEGTQSFRRKAWFSLLACVFPCLCLYPPMTRIYHSERFHKMCSCCGACSPLPSPKEPHTEEVPSTRRRRNRRKIVNAAKHVPVSQGATKANVGSKKRFDQMHPQSSRTSSSQQMLNDSYLNFKTVSGYGSLLHQSLDGGNVIAEKSSCESSKTDSSGSKMTRPLNSRLSF